jgi:hypothetical protein
MEEESVDSAEDCGIRSDAEGERQDGNGREARLLQEATNCVANVIYKRVHNFLGVAFGLWSLVLCIFQGLSQKRRTKHQGQKTRKPKVKDQRPIRTVAPRGDRSWLHAAQAGSWQRRRRP